MKVIPNCISFSRIIFSLILIFLKPLSLIFYVIYIICGLSDIMDGFIARNTGTTSKLGEKIDSMADMIMAGVLLFIFYPIVNPSRVVLTWVVLIAIIRFTAMFVAMKKYKTFAMLHTYGNKITGLVLFIFPVLLSCIHANMLMYIICALASISAIEELIIQIISRELKANRKSIFIKWA